MYETVGYSVLWQSWRVSDGEWYLRFQKHRKIIEDKRCILTWSQMLMTILRYWLQQILKCPILRCSILGSPSPILFIEKITNILILSPTNFICCYHKVIIIIIIYSQEKTLRYMMAKSQGYRNLWFFFGELHTLVEHLSYIFGPIKRCNLSVQKWQKVT